MRNMPNRPSPPPPGPETIRLIDRPWIYRGEGGANLVISLMPVEATVVRFAKSKYSMKDSEGKIGEMVYFANEVMSPLLGPEYVRPLRIGKLATAEDFDHVRTEAQPFRPQKRCNKEINSRRAVLSPDCTMLTNAGEGYSRNTKGATISFEIKPKQGWHSLKASCSVDLCHRCLKKNAQLYEGEIDRISPYCPLDLFSGDPTRMKRAVFDLMEEPANRFKMFQNGELVYCEGVGSKIDFETRLAEMLGENESPKDAMAALLISALLAPLAEKMNHKMPIVVQDLLRQVRPNTLPRQAFKCDTNNDGELLPKGCILERILTLQKHTTITDHEAKDLCDTLLNNIDDIEGLHQIIMWHPNEAKLADSLTPSEIEMVMQLQRYLLATTAKDVSLMITLKELDSLVDESYDYPVITFKQLGKSFRLMVSTIDLDPKPVHRIPTWVKRKEKWLKIYFDSTIHKEKIMQTKVRANEIIKIEKESDEEIII